MKPNNADTRRHAPADPEGFVREAERITNERDLSAVDTIFAPHAAWTSVIDGMVIEDVGRHAIARRWQIMCRYMTARNAVVSKHLVTCGPDTIVNEWSGTLGRHARARGIEIWHFDAHGRVDDQRLYGFLAAGPETSPAPNLRMLAAHPVTAATFGWLRLRAIVSERRN